MHARYALAPRSRVAIAACAVAVLAATALTRAQPNQPDSVVERIREGGRIRLGYRADARPFSYRNDAGQAAGYSIVLCQKVAEDLKGELHLSGLTVEWVAVAFDDRFRALQQGRIDLLCGADTVTLARRSDVAFSIPVFPGGIGALVRADAPARLRDVLGGHGQPFRPSWRATAGQFLQTRTFSAVAGSTADKWLAERFDDLEIAGSVTPVQGYDAGVRGVLDRKADVFFGERAVLMDAAVHHPSARSLTMIDRLFTYEPLAFAMARGDDDFRLLVDRALSRVYRSGAIGSLYAKTFGEPDENAITFFRWNALPE